MNAHDAIVSAIVSALLASPPLAGGRVAEEAAFDALPEGVAQAISVAMVRSLAQAVLVGGGAPIDWRTTVRIQCLARADAAGAGGRASRALHAQVYARLMADPTLGGLAGFIEPPALASDTELLGSRLGALTADYVVSHRTSATALDT